jgi:lipopolysaccharide biosynthesis regulator YciM
MARPRKYNYTGTKKVVSIRLTDDEVKKILRSFDSIQQFVQASLDFSDRYYCPHCGTTEMLCGYNGVGCSSRS